MSHEPRHARAPSDDFRGDRDADLGRGSGSDVHSERHTNTLHVRFGHSLRFESIPRFRGFSATSHAPHETETHADGPLDRRLVDLMIVRHDQHRHTLKISRQRLPHDRIVMLGAEELNGRRVRFVLAQAFRDGRRFSRVTNRHGKTQ